MTKERMTALAVAGMIAFAPYAMADTTKPKSTKSNSSRHLDNDISPGGPSEVMTIKREQIGPPGKPDRPQQDGCPPPQTMTVNGCK